MPLPSGWTPIAFDADRGVPQSAPLPGGPAGLRAMLVSVVADLAALLSAPADVVVHDAADRRAPVPGPAPAEVGPYPARAHAERACTAPPPDSLSTAAVPVHVLVVGAAGPLTAWPAVPDRPLPVHDGDRLLGELWVDDVRLAAGALVNGGRTGSRVSVGWRPLTAPAATARRTAPDLEEDPYAGLV